LSISFFDQEFTKDAHDKGLEVYVFVANEQDDIRWMKELGVDGVLSNFPDRI
jgi:glycerophosphoryl diester phosphodiesterase